jgi:hypothetical protein
MSPDDTTANEARYTVDVNPEVAFSIIYDDDRGRLVFSIEVGDDPKLIFLNPRPSDGNHMVDARDEATQARIGLAVSRVTAYFNAKGLNVEID